MLVSSVLFLYVACEVSVWNWFKTYLISIHFSASEAGGVLSYGFGLGMLLGRFAASRILLRIAPMRLIIVSAACIMVTTFVMIHVSSHLAVTIAALAIVGDYFPQNSATAMGIAVTSGWIGLAVSSPIVGMIAAKSSLQDALTIFPMIAGAIVLVSMVLNTRLSKTRRT
jgi:fucose permease